MPGRPKRFIAIGISIAAMAMSTFNTVWITQLNEEISTLKEKTDLILDVVHLHEKHLHHLEEKLDQTNKLLADLLEANIWFSSKVTDAIEKKFESVVWHHETWSNRPSTTNWHLEPFHTTSWMGSLTTSRPLPRRRTWFHLSPSLPTSSKSRSHTYTLRLQMSSHSSYTSRWSPILIFWTFKHFCHYQFTSTLRPSSRSRQMSDKQTFSQSDTRSLFKPFPAQICMLVSTWDTLSFAKEGKSWKQAWKDPA